MITLDQYIGKFTPVFYPNFIGKKWIIRYEYNSWVVFYLDTEEKIYSIIPHWSAGDFIYDKDPFDQEEVFKWFESKLNLKDFHRILP